MHAHKASMQALPCHPIFSWFFAICHFRFVCRAIFDVSEWNIKFPTSTSREINWNGQTILYKLADEEDSKLCGYFTWMLCSILDWPLRWIVAMTQQYPKKIIFNQLLYDSWFFNKLFSLARLQSDCKNTLLFCKTHLPITRHCVGSRHIAIIE